MSMPWLLAHSWLLCSWRKGRNLVQRNPREVNIASAVVIGAMPASVGHKVWHGAQPASYPSICCFADWNLRVGGVRPDPKVGPCLWPGSNSLSLKDQLGLPRAQRGEKSIRCRRHVFNEPFHFENGKEKSQCTFHKNLFCVYIYFIIFRCVSFTDCKFLKALSVSSASLYPQE